MELVALKLLITPPVTEISPTSKFVVGSLAVKVTVRVESIVLAPFATAVPLALTAVIVMVGAVLSINPLYKAIVLSFHEAEIISGSPSLSMSAACSEIAPSALVVIERVVKLGSAAPYNY